MSVRSILMITGATLALAASTAFAAPANADDAKSLTPAQQRMADCSHQNAGKTGADYKAAQSACLKGQPAAPAPEHKLTQQEKMKACNADPKAGTLKGDDRKAFMSDCLKNGPAPH